MKAGSVYRLSGLAGLALLAALTLPGCPGNLENKDDFFPYFVPLGPDGKPGCLVEKTFFDRCTKDGTCHQAATHAGGLDLASPGVRGRLVGKVAVHGDLPDSILQVNCTMGDLLVDPANPHQSWLWKKVNDVEINFCGNAMPPIRHLQQADRDCINAFIDGTATGVAGSAGTAGAAGSAGASGSAGAAGSAGASGSAGTGGTGGSTDGGAGTAGAGGTGG